MRGQNQKLKDPTKPADTMGHVRKTLLNTWRLKRPGWTPKKFRDMRKALGMTQAEFAEAAGISPRKVLSWESPSSSQGRLPKEAMVVIEFVQDQVVKKAGETLTNAKAE
jgi:DNA-binding transcriptional regulator YiaG